VLDENEDVFTLLLGTTRRVLAMTGNEDRPKRQGTRHTQAKGGMLRKAYFPLWHGNQAVLQGNNVSRWVQEVFMVGEVDGDNGPDK